MTLPLSISSNSPKATQRLGMHLGQMAEPGDVFLLNGTLGAGKTHLAQGIAWGLGVGEYARSPTFVIINLYHGRLKVYHIDLFRLQDSEEASDLGIEEYLNGDGVCVVEWADNFPNLFSENSLWINLDYTNVSRERHITINLDEHTRPQISKTLAQLFGKQQTRSDGHLCIPRNSVGR